MDVRDLRMVTAACLTVLMGGCVAPQSTVLRRTQPPVPAEGQPWVVPGLHLRLAYVAPGRFQMGSTEGETNELPVHDVSISRAYWIGITEVTQVEYQAIMAAGGDPVAATRANPSAFPDGRHPVETVSWDDAVAFCATLTERERAAGRLPGGYEFRLPTEAEWEYTARGGNRSMGFVYSGSSIAAKVAWYDANSRNAPHPVGRKAPNELGLYDMSGNVWEWCLDGYDPGFYARSPATDPVNAQAAGGRVLRGGCWGFPCHFARSASRAGFSPAYACDGLGFRVVLAAPVGIL
jgi:formylglycine-generating enzyme required for sulfatase activity